MSLGRTLKCDKPPGKNSKCGLGKRPGKLYSTLRVILPLRKDDEAEGVNALRYTQLQTPRQYGGKLLFDPSISFIFLSGPRTRSPPHHRASAPPAHFSSEPGVPRSVT